MEEKLGSNLILFFFPLQERHKTLQNKLGKHSKHRDCASTMQRETKEKESTMTMAGQPQSDSDEDSATVLRGNVDNCRSGYMADLEDADNTYDRLREFRSGKLNVGRIISRPSKRRRKESLVVPIEDCSWIQRIYRGTPSSLTFIAKNTAQDDFSFMPCESSGDTVEGVDRFVTPSFNTKRSSPKRHRLPLMVNEFQPITPFASQDSWESSSTCSDSSDTNSDSADEDQDAANLLKTLSDMLAESQENQARYRSYSQGER